MTGTAGGRCAAKFIEERFGAAGLSTRRQIFPFRLRGDRVEGVNVLARMRGTSSRTLVVLAHYDAPVTSRDAAADNATGVATLLELARIFSRETPARTLIFVATDAGVWGSLGADVFAREKGWEAFPGQSGAAPYAAVSLDHLAPGTAAGIEIEGGGQFSGFAPLWLRATAAMAAASAGARVFPEGPLSQIVSRAVPITFHDQGPMLRRGIPAVNLRARSHREEEAKRIALTGEDRPENIRPGALKLFGDASELAVRAALDAGVTESPDVITLTSRRTIPRGRIRWIAALLFLPLAVLALDAWRRGRTDLRSVLLSASWALPVVLAVLALRIAIGLDLLPRFPLYPAAPRDPFLRHWAPLPMAGALAAALLGGVAAAGLSRRAGKTAGLSLLLLAAVWAWARNDLAAALFLAPAALAWPWIGAAGAGRGRWLDVALLLIGLAPFGALVLVAAERLLLGPWIFWYGALLPAYGALGLQAAGIAGLVLAAALAFGRESHASGETGG